MFIWAEGIPLARIKPEGRKRRGGQNCREVRMMNRERTQWQLPNYPSGEPEGNDSSGFRALGIQRSSVQRAPFSV